MSQKRRNFIAQKLWWRHSSSKMNNFILLLNKMIIFYHFLSGITLRLSKLPRGLDQQWWIIGCSWKNSWNCRKIKSHHPLRECPPFLQRYWSIGVQSQNSMWNCKNNHIFPFHVIFFQKYVKNALFSVSRHSHYLGP